MRTKARGKAHPKGKRPVAGSFPAAKGYRFQIGPARPAPGARLKLKGPTGNGRMAPSPIRR
jgi:hypothetical protein